jgi:hypothetical protein
MMAGMNAFLAIVHANGGMWLALFALTALDLAIATTRAVAARRFSSRQWRATADKLIGEAGLPLLLAILATADRSFGALVTIALWWAIAGEATSIVEQIRGKAPSALLDEVLHLLSAGYIDAGAPVKGTVVRTALTDRSSPTPTAAPTDSAKGG